MSRQGSSLRRLLIKSMDHQTALLIAWSMGTAAASYGLFAAYLISLGQTGAQRRARPC